MSKTPHAHAQALKLDANEHEFIENPLFVFKLYI